MFDFLAAQTVTLGSTSILKFFQVARTIFQPFAMPHLYSCYLRAAVLRGSLLFAQPAALDCSLVQVEGLLAAQSEKLQADWRLGQEQSQMQEEQSAAHVLELQRHHTGLQRLAEQLKVSTAVPATCTGVVGSANEGAYVMKAALTASAVGQFLQRFRCQNCDQES